MRAAAARALPSTYSVVIVTTDELVGPEAETQFASDYDLHLLRTWPELVLFLKKQAPDAILLDIDTVGERSDDGIAGLAELRALNRDLVIVALTRSSSRNLHHKAIDAAVDEYFIAPINFEEVRVVLGRLLEKRAAEIEYRLRQEQDAQEQSFAELVGGSEPMLRMYEAIKRVANSNTTVLLRGESGSGKELVARAIVSFGPRAEKPFISINCAALPENLIETELFGHEKGAFTDAKEARPGHIELAHTGTLFLDEIATLGLALQSKLLRVLEDRAVTRIGGKTSKKIDFRLLAATNEDLEEMVQMGRFREDLYYRINVIPIVVPPLRERKSDLPLLVDHFLRIYCHGNDKPLKQVESEVLAVFEDYDWPGNVRELENVIQRLVIMNDSPLIGIKDLPQHLLVASSASQEAILIPEEGVNFDAEMERIELAYLQAALNRTGGKKSAAAALLGIDIQRMKYLCRKRNL
ncbi:MAG TPA: sigma-54 dependent transcriptional regulator [Terriglobales bacterium]|nr:sigma-54 dependent transcriptional regulator [Terriglobales bacterium]